MRFSRSAEAVLDLANRNVQASPNERHAAKDALPSGGSTTRRRSPRAPAHHAHRRRGGSQLRRSGRSRRWPDHPRHRDGIGLARSHGNGPIEGVGPSVNEVLAGAGGWTNRGFRYATTTEVCTFFDHLGLVPDPCPGSTAAGSTTAIMDLIGESSCCPGQSVYAVATFDDGGDPSTYGQGGYVLSLQTGGRVNASEASIGVDVQAFFNSHFLVRASPPAPSVPLLDEKAMRLLICALILVTLTVTSATSKRRGGGTSLASHHPHPC